MVLSESSWPLFRSKAKAIINEELLSIRIRESGHMILPYDIPLFLFTKVRGVFRKAKWIFLQKQKSNIGSTVLNGR